MAILGTETYKSELGKMAAGLSERIAGEGLDQSTDNTTMRAALGLESIDPTLMEDSERQMDEITTGLRNYCEESLGLAGVDVDNNDLSPLTKMNMNVLESAIDSAKHVLAANTDKKAYQKQYFDMSCDSSLTPISQFNREFGMESFDNVTFENWQTTEMISNAMVTIGNSFSNAFWHPYVQAATGSGMELHIQLPYTYRRTPRSLSGAPTYMEKKTLIEAEVDASILEDNSQKIVPHAAADGSNDDFLVAASFIGDRPADLAGIPFQTRPLATNKTVDLISISNASHLIGAGEQNESDTLSGSIYVNDLYVSLSNSTDIAAMRVPTRFYQSSLFTAAQEGQALAKTVNLDVNVRLLSTDKVAFNDTTTLEEDSNIGTLIGAAAGTVWAIDVELNVSGSVDERNNGILRAAGASIKAAYKGATADALANVSNAEMTALLAGAAISIPGWDVKASRSNSNMRNSGKLVDAGTATKWSLPIPTDAPFSTQSPIDMDGGSVQLDVLTRTRMTRNANTSVTRLFEAAERLENYREGNGSVGIPGELLVKPTFLRKAVNVKDTTVYLNNTVAMESLRHALINAVSTMTTNLLRNSDYLSALSQMTGSDKNYEIVVGTDPYIANYLMTSGDARTLGNDRNYMIVSSRDSRMKNKIFITLRRAGQTGPDALSFGVHGTVPAVTYKASVSRTAGSVTTETQLLPRDEFYNLCPILGLIDVQGLDEVFFTRPA